MRGRATVAPVPDPSVRRDVPYRITAVCLGNICRSPMAEAVLRARLAAAGLDRVTEVDSAGTGGWHVGEDADPRARAALRRRGYPLAHAARRFDPAWFATSDLILAMDAENHRTLLRLAPDEEARERIRFMRAFDPAATDGGRDLDVPDPYYGGDDGFDDVLDLLEAAADGVVAHVRTQLDGGQ